MIFNQTASHFLHPIRKKQKSILVIPECRTNQMKCSIENEGIVQTALLPDCLLG
jgi:hypothetical protein